MGPFQAPLLLLAVTATLLACTQVSSVVIPLTSASSGHPPSSYAGSYTSGQYGGYGSNPYKISKGYNPYSGALMSSMPSASPYSSAYTSSYTSPYTNSYTSPYSYGSMSGMGSYYDQMPAYETAIEVHGAGFY